MRITGGRARGIGLRAGRNSAARPATDKMREAVFSSLGDRIHGGRFLDLFAGTGAYGLEAWSRGAAGGVFVEKNRMMAEAIRQNAEAVARSLGEEVTMVQVVAADALKWKPADPSVRWDLLLVDPPYEIIPTVAPSLFLRFGEWLATDGLVVFEMPGEIQLSSPGWECFKRLGKGARDPSCCFFRRCPAPQA